MIQIQQADFDVGAIYNQLRQTTRAGAVVTFTGLVRDFNQDSSIQTMTLEHYPGMTDKVLSQIEQDARQRWPLEQVVIIHRVGELHPSDQIVLVAVSSAHRQAAFAACEFIMDLLKTQAPFWKKEQTDAGSHWVAARESDQQQVKRWE